jgi:hypothetical protein
MAHKEKITTEQEAIAYIKKVLTWAKWRKHHSRLIQALEIILQKLSR